MVLDFFLLVYVLHNFLASFFKIYITGEKEGIMDYVWENIACLEGSHLWPVSLASAL